LKTGDSRGVVARRSALRRFESPGIVGARGWAGLALAGSALLCGVPVRDAFAAGTKTHTVTIENMRFDPENLVVGPGDRIVWINKDLFPHTASASSRAFDSGSIAPNASWEYVAGKPGAYLYTCSFHPTMHAALTVRDDGSSDARKPATNKPR